MPLIPEVLDLRLGGRKALALAVVRFGSIEIRGVRVKERDGRLRVSLPGVVLDPALFREVHRAVLDAYRQTVEADPWADARRAP